MTIVYAVARLFSCMRELVVLIQCPEIELWERFVWSHFFGTLDNTFGNNKQCLVFTNAAITRSTLYNVITF
jgi:hypothetical protein